MRNLETALARFTLGSLLIYFPLESWVSWPYGLWHPMYLVDFVAMVLMLIGGLHSLRARPEPAFNQKTISMEDSSIFWKNAHASARPL